MRRISTITLLSTSVLLAAAAQLEAQRLYTYSNGSIPVSKDREPPRIERFSVKGEDRTVTIPPVMPAEAFRLVDYLDLSEQNLTYYMASRDNFEIQLAAIAGQKASDARVRDLAAIIGNDRKNRVALVDEIIREENHGEGVGVAQLQRDPEMGRLRELVAHFDKLQPGQDFDAAYVRTVFFLHQNELDVLNANIKNAHDDDFERLIKESIKSMTNTREVIRSVAQSMGVSLP